MVWKALIMWFNQQQVHLIQIFYMNNLEIILR